MKLYEIIYENLKKQISAGEFGRDTLLPTELELQKTYNVSRITAKHAYEKLAEEGLVERIPGKGTVLASPKPPRKSKLIGMVLCNFDSNFGVQLIKSAQAAAAEHGYSLVLDCSYDDDKKESEILSRFCSLGVEGILIQNCHGTFTKNLLTLSLQEYPVVSVDRYAKGLQIPCVTSDNSRASADAASFFLHRGHQKILFVSAPTQSTSTLTERLEGFQKAHIQHGAALSEINFMTDLKSPLTNQAKDVEADIGNLAACLQNKEITAVIAAEYMAAELVRITLRKLHRRCPDDVELLCFDCQSPMLENSSFTHIQQDEIKLGRLAVEKLIAQIAGKRVNMRDFIETRLVIGNSTRNENG